MQLLKKMYIHVYVYVYFNRTPKTSTLATFERSNSQIVPQHMENFTNSTIHSAIHIHVTLLLFLLISTATFSLWKVNVIIKWLCNDSSLLFCTTLPFSFRFITLDPLCSTGLGYTRQYFSMKITSTWNQPLAKWNFSKFTFRYILIIIICHSFLGPLILQFISK